MLKTETPEELIKRIEVLQAANIEQGLTIGRLTKVIDTRDKEIQLWAKWHYQLEKKLDAIHTYVSEQFNQATDPAAEQVCMNIGAFIMFYQEENDQDANS